MAGTDAKKFMEEMRAGDPELQEEYDKIPACSYIILHEDKDVDITERRCLHLQEDHKDGECIGCLNIITDAVAQGIVFVEDIHKHSFITE